MTVDLFALAMVVVLAVGVIVGWGFRLPRSLLSGRPLAKEGRSQAAGRSSEISTAPEPPARARAVADAVLRLARREPAASPGVSAAVERFARPRDLSAGTMAGARPTSAHPLGYTLRRRTARPRTAGVERLDNIR
jgi:hypothetical protein